MHALEADGNRTPCEEFERSPSKSVGSVEAEYPEPSIVSGLRGSIAGSVSVDAQDRAMRNELRTMQQPAFVKRTDISSTL